MKISSTQGFDPAGSVTLTTSGAPDLPRSPVVLDSVAPRGEEPKPSNEKNFGFRQGEITDLNTSISELGSLFGKSVKLEVTDTLGAVKIRIVDNESNQVIREYPPEEFIDLLKRVQKTLGLLVDKKV